MVITSIDLNQIQLQILIAQSCGADPDSVVLSFAVTDDPDAPADADSTAVGTFSAVVKTDIKGAQRVERALKKGDK